MTKNERGGCMVNFDQFCKIAEEINEQLPQSFFKELNGGVQADPHRKVHPKSVGDELVILGEYHRDYYFGRYIVLYYGSFLQLYGNAPEEVWKYQLDHTIRHEFRHHLESLAGERDLEVEDAVRLAQYQGRYKGEF